MRSVHGATMPGERDKNITLSRLQHLDNSVNSFQGTQTHGKTKKYSFIIWSVKNSNLWGGFICQRQGYGFKVSSMWTKREEYLNTSHSTMWNFSLTFFWGTSVEGTGQKCHLKLIEPLSIGGVAKSHLLFGWNFNGWFSVPKGVDSCNRQMANNQPAYSSYTRDGSRLWPYCLWV